MKTITEKDIELLQRYYIDWDCYEYESDNGEYVRWDSLIQLLK